MFNNCASGREVRWRMVGGRLLFFSLRDAPSGQADAAGDKSDAAGGCIGDTGSGDRLRDADASSTSGQQPHTLATLQSTWVPWKCRLLARCRRRATPSDIILT